jgi:hypothetical protein
MYIIRCRFQCQHRHESLAIVTTESQLVYSELMQSLVLIAFNFKLENVLQVSIKLVG